MRFRVGDKVKLVGSVFWIDRYYTNKIGTITEIGMNSSFSYTVGVDAVKIPVGECEMEKVVTKGQQLLFSFME